MQPDQVQSNQVQPDQVQPGQVQSDQVHSDQVHSDQVQPEQVQPEQVQPEQVQPEQVQPEQVQVEQVEEQVDNLSDLLTEKDFSVRKELIYKHGWQHFRVWFEEQRFFNHWQLNQLGAGVPLHRIKKANWIAEQRIDKNHSHRLVNLLYPIHTFLHLKSNLLFHSNIIFFPFQYFCKTEQGQSRKTYCTFSDSRASEIKTGAYPIKEIFN